MLFVVGVVCGVAMLGLPKAVKHLHSSWHGLLGVATCGAGERAQTEEKFPFTARASIDKVGPLFGADQERVWALGWNPQFIHPLPAADEPGMVFTVAHDHLKAAWVNTEFDLQNGRVQYVYVIPDALVTVITLKMTPQGKQTLVEVAYDRPALRANADGHVWHMAEGDRGSEPDREKQVNEYLEKSKG